MFSSIGYISQGSPLIYPNDRVLRVERYEMLVAPAIEPVSLEDVKQWLKIPNAITIDDNLINSLIVAVKIFFEDYTNRILINTTFRNFSNCFAQSFEFSRGKLQSLDSFQYLVNGSFIDVPSDTYQVLDETFYWRIIFSQYQNLPNNKDDNVDIYQGIRTDFIAGFGATQADIPEDIKIGLYNHIAALYENRGDCDNAVCGDCSGSLPTVSKMIYNKYRYQTAFGAKYRGI